MSEIREFWITKDSGIPDEFAYSALWDIKHKPELKTVDRVGVVDGEVAVVTSRHWKSDEPDAGVGDFYAPLLGMGAEPKIARVRVEIVDD